LYAVAATRVRRSATSTIVSLMRTEKELGRTGRDATQADLLPFLLSSSASAQHLRYSCSGLLREVRLSSRFGVPGRVPEQSESRRASFVSLSHTRSPSLRSDDRPVLSQYDAFWNRSFDVEDISGIDMRWLALLFIVLAYGCLLGWTEEEGAEGIRDRDEGAKTWYWAARRAIMSSPTFHGVSSHSCLFLTREHESADHTSFPPSIVISSSCLRSTGISRHRPSYDSGHVLPRQPTSSSRRSVVRSRSSFPSVRSNPDATSLLPFFLLSCSLALDLVRCSVRSSSGFAYRWIEMEPLAERS